MTHTKSMRDIKLQRHQSSVMSFKKYTPKFGKLIQQDNDIQEKLKQFEKIVTNFLNPWHLIKSENNVNIFSDVKNVNIDQFDQEKATKILDLKEQSEFQTKQIEYLQNKQNRNNTYVWDMGSKVLLVLLAYHNSSYIRGILGGPRF